MRIYFHTFVSIAQKVISHFSSRTIIISVWKMSSYRRDYRGMSSRYAAFAAYRCENPSAAAGALASNWILRRWRCWGNASLLRKEGLTKTCFRRSSFLNKDNHASRGYLLKIQSLAVRGGFEPPEPLRVRQFSKLLVSATHPSHRVGSAKVVIFY